MIQLTDTCELKAQNLRGKCVVPMDVLNLRAHLESVNLPICGGKPTDTPANILDWYKMGIVTRLRKNN